MPDGSWAFDDKVTEVFDDMLERSIPQYPVMRQAVAEMAIRYVKPGTTVLDLGCSRGAALATLVDAVDKAGLQRVSFLGTEVSEPMLAAARQRFEGDARVLVEHSDLRGCYPEVFPSVTLLVLTLQFTPIEYRQRILRNAWAATRPGGALILVEKVLGATADINDDLVSVYYGMKARNGYSQEQIDRKRLSLEGVLVPVTAAWNEELLRMAGFTSVECFWRWMNFSAWIAVKEP